MLAKNLSDRIIIKSLRDPIKTKVKFDYHFKTRFIYINWKLLII